MVQSCLWAVMRPACQQASYLEAAVLKKVPLRTHMGKSTHCCRVLAGGGHSSQTTKTNPTWKHAHTPGIVSPYPL